MNCSASRQANCGSFAGCLTLISSLHFWLRRQRGLFMDYTEEQVLFEDTLTKAIQRTSPPEKVAKLDAAKTFDGELYAVLRDLGVWGLGVEEAWGGSGGTNMEQLI